MKKTFLISAVCFVVGGLMGATGAWVGTMIHSGRLIADSLSIVQEAELGDAGQRAFAAYQHESPPVAIYALSQYIDKLQQLEKQVGTTSALTDKTMFSYEMLLAHARLAKLYAESGQSNLNTQNVSEALMYAGRIPKLQMITNEAALTEVLARVDKKASK